MCARTYPDKTEQARQPEGKCVLTARTAVVPGDALSPIE